MHFDFLIPVLYTDADIAFYDRFARRLEQAGCVVGLIAHTRDGEQRLAAAHPHVFYLYEGFRRGQPVDLVEQARIERKYNLPSLADHVFSEQNYPWARPPEQLIPRAIHCFGFLERLLVEHSASFFLNNIGGEIVRRTMARLAEAGGPRNLIVDFAPLHGRIALTTSEVSWDDLPAVPPPLSAAEATFTRELMAGVTTAQKMFCAPSSLGWKPRNLVNFARMAAASMREGSEDVSVARLSRERVQRLVRRAVNQRFFEPPRDDERFIFFPLHLASDSAITIRAPQFQRQEFLVQYLAERALPTGVTLYVKPHVGARDAYAIPMMAKIRALPRVRLIEPTVNSHHLIQRAEAMVVINSTVGFESLFYNRPVVVLGRVFYRGFGVTTDVENLADLRTAVRDAIARPPDPEAVLRFLHACYRATAPGRFGDASDENIERVVEALLAKAARLGRPVGRAPRVNGAAARA